MFEEELVMENPDNSSCVSILETPKRPKRNRKRTRSGQSTSGALESRSDESNKPHTAQPCCKTKMLNKKERSQIVTSIKKCPILEEVTENFLKSESPIFKELVSQKEILTSLIEFHRQTFINLYEGNGTGKDKYISFQLQWHEHCSILLLPKHLPIQCVILPPTNTMETTRQLWLDFCGTSRNDEEKHKKFMILFSSAIYDVLLREADKRLIKITVDTPGTATRNTPVIRDGDDVYFRFGGGTLASMLHCRYNGIRKCGDEKREIISLEIAVLQAINTRDKSSMPSYLKYRDKGYMYSPDVSFIPFFRAVDECIKEVVNEKGLEQHGDKIIKVHCFKHF